MKLLLLVLCAEMAFSAGWEAVQRTPRGSKISVATRGADEFRARFVSADENTVVIHTDSGEKSIARGDIRRVKIADPSRRVRNGLLATAIGAGAGLAIGVAVCPHCANEGSGWKYTGPLTAIGAGAGLAGFVPLPYRTIYQSK